MYAASLYTALHCRGRRHRRRRRRRRCLAQHQTLLLTWHSNGRTAPRASTQKSPPRMDSVHKWDAVCSDLKHIYTHIGMNNNNNQ